jgi:hypothetical protein
VTEKGREMRVIIQLAYLLMGGSIGLALTLLSPYYRKHGIEEGIPDIAFAMVGSVLSYEFSASVWAHLAASSHLPGTPSESFSTAILLVLFDHPVICASISSALFCISLRLARRAVTGWRRDDQAV